MTTKSKNKITKIHPRNSWVLVKPVSPELQNDYGIIIPQNVEKEKKSQGEIVEVGPKVEGLKKGQRVLYGMYAGEDIQLENKAEQGDRIDFTLLLEEDILAILE